MLVIYVAEGDFLRIVPVVKIQHEAKILYAVTQSHTLPHKFTTLFIDTKNMQSQSKPSRK